MRCFYITLNRSRQLSMHHGFLCRIHRLLIVLPVCFVSCVDEADCLSILNVMHSVWIRIGQLKVAQWGVDGAQALQAPTHFPVFLLKFT